MQKITRAFLLGVIMTVFGLQSQAQVIDNTNTSTQNCVGDTITVFFSVLSPFNAGNQFRVELSTPAGTFPGQFIEINPLLAFSIGSYQIPAVIPASTSQGVYKIRVTATNPIYAGDTVNNVIVGDLPSTQMTIYGAHYINGNARFCNGDTVFLKGPTPPLGETYLYEWFNNGNKILGQTNDTLIVLNSGSYAVKVTKGLCDAISNDTIINSYTPPAFITGGPATPNDVVQVLGVDSIRMCIGNTGLLRGPIPLPAPQTFTFEWLTDSINFLGQRIFYPIAGDTNQLFVDSTLRVYLRVVDDIGGCADTSLPFWVIVDTLPRTNIVNVPWPGQTVPTLNLCPEDSTMITAVDTVKFPDWKYQWQAQFPLSSSTWVNLPNDTLPYLQVDTALIPDSARFRLYIKNETCEYLTNSLQVNIVPNPVFSFFPGDSLAICEGDSILVLLQGDALQYRWDGGAFIGSSRWIKDQGFYVVEGRGVNGCSTFDTLQLVYNIVNADAGPDQTIAPGETVQHAGSGGVGYYWSAGTPVKFSDRFIADPTSEPTEDTTMYVLQVTGPNGCSAYDTMYVFIVDNDPNAGFNNVMNAITPNGDNLNDMLDLSEIIRGDDAKLTVLDRWGNLVFEERPYLNDWQGTNNGGDELPDGTYYIILQVNDEIRYKGPVTIIRNK
ncbi:MAG: gliding motility-associated C-terminal domain-containing protein [Bacteroidota bacterium]|nr:gliding motility-associated C-terminal domain-containing protein [Bacteroidota bacterium]MDX5428842.1 gliding motility-associated C-terminal domain-containing protein [Bacteroidota bacterium]MDX5448726.1 gliding motility-associated C-terminal domain-containing protein [Bacteroidota bacterium]MDX5506529.1 gliding motility-associated C-terminal domain-containing protein [Bacteroidota bacterium]